MKKDQIELCAKEIVDSAVQVHKELGPGLLESVYQYCLSEELRLRRVRVQQEVFLPLTYRGKELNKDFRIDMLIETEVIIEVKAVDVILPVHEAQLLSYLKLSRKWLGFILNFNVPVRKEGIRRRVNGYR